MTLEEILLLFRYENTIINKKTNKKIDVYSIDDVDWSNENKIMFLQKMNCDKIQIKQILIDDDPEFDDPHLIDLIFIPENAYTKKEI